MADQPKDKQDEQKLKDRFTSDLKTARKFMDPIHQLMDKNYEMYRNRWSDNKCDFQVSDLHAYVETVVPILTNNRTRTTVRAEFPDYVQHAEGMNYILDNAFDINDWDYNAQRVARMAEIYRSAIAYTGYDTEAKNGTGQLCIKEINIRWCYLDSAAIQKMNNSNYFFYVEPQRVSKVCKDYSKKADEIRKSLGKREGLSADRQNSGNWFKSWVNTFKNAVATISGDKKSMQRLNDYQWLQEIDEQEKYKNSVAFIHYWYRDEDTDEWRVSFWSDEILLEDMANPFIHGELPYDIYSPTEDVLSLLGIPMAEQIENLNYEKNVIMDQIVKHAKIAADPPMMYNTVAGLKDPQALRERAKDTGVVPINNPDFAPLNSIAEFFTPSPLPNYVEVLPDRFNGMEDRLTGVNDSFRGMSEATSGKEVQLKQEAAYTRIKTKVDNFEKFVKSISNKTIVNAMQFCKENRAYRVKGDYSKHQAMGDNGPFQVKPIPIGQDEQGQTIHDKKQFFLYANPNEWTKVEQAPADPSQPPTPEQPVSDDRSKGSIDAAMRILQMTVDIEAGSSLPTSPMARKEEAKELFEAGAIDQQALLDAYDYPHADEILQRMQQAAQAQQQAEAQAKQAELQQQMELKKMELQFKAQEQAMNHQQQTNVAQMNNDAKTQQDNTKNQPQQPEQPDIAGGLDKLREADPRLANLSDEELMSLISQMTA